MMNKRSLFYGFIALQVILLSVIAFTYYATEWFGEEVRLKTEPVDPRDLLYGDYVILNYDISLAHLTDVKTDINWEEERSYGTIPVYVVLEKGEYGKLVGVYKEKPRVINNKVVLKAKMHFESRRDYSVRLKYGFERFYADTKTAKDLEMKNGEFDVIIKVSPWGQKISRLEFK
jgi:uncharacterized membrane-anchored protein